LRSILPNLATLIDGLPVTDSGDASIWAAARLDNLDKHNRLIAVTSVQTIRGFKMIDKRKNSFDFDFAVEQGRVLIPIVYVGQDDPEYKILDPGKLGAAILFAPDLPLAGHPIIPSLTSMAHQTTKAIETLEAFHFTPG